jgi:hypothetical protein
MRTKKRPTINVIFRLLQEEFDALKGLGVQCDESPGQCARRILRATLNNTRGRKLHGRIRALEKTVDAVTEKVDLLIEMVEASTSVLLTHAGKLSTTDAKEWVESSFR